MQANTIAKRPLKNGFSEMYEQMNWYISPLTHWVTEYAIKPQLSPESLKPKSVRPSLKLSQSLILVIALLTLISLMSVLWFSRNKDISKKEWVAWLLLICMTSITGMLTFLLLTDKKIKINKSQSIINREDYVK